MFEKNPVIFLVDANSILDVPDGSVLGREFSVKIADVALAITPKLEAVGHIAGAVFAQIKGVLPLVRVVGVATVTLLAQGLLGGGKTESSYYGTTISAKERR